MSANVPRSRLITAALVVLTLAALAPAAATYWREWVIVDGCLDAGGSIDYVRMRCDRTDSHAFVPFRARHGRLMSETLMRLGVVALLALALGVGEAARRRRSRTGR